MKKRALLRTLWNLTVTAFWFVIAVMFFQSCIDDLAHCAMAQGNSQCELIRDPDRRHMCRALTTGKAIYCESIRDKELRLECRARLAKK